jgi:hypothetical protein
MMQLKLPRRAVFCDIFTNSRSDTYLARDDRVCELTGLVIISVLV